MAKSFFSQHDLDRIAAAVQAAERKTSGEIVPYFVAKSDDYEEAVWRGGALGAFAVLTVLALYHVFTETWGSFSPLEIILSAIGAMGVAMLLVQLIPALKRFFAGNELIEERVAQRAAQAFITEEVFRTRDRTGILVFLSLLEHKVLVVGDAGINAKVEQSEWQDVVARVVRGIDQGTAVEGLIDAVQQCGQLLQKRGVKRRAHDRNELSNKLRVERRRKK